MLVKEIIRRKRDGHTLTDAEIEYMARGIGDGSIGEGQAAAFAMAVFFQNLNRAETVSLTRAMSGSGTRLNWPRGPGHGPILDKHSTGGVGDKVSLVLAPMLAACGARVPMISGRGLGHTGGTLDKLEAIPGYRTRVDAKRLHDTLRAAGCAIIGAGQDLVPADQRLYAIRDVTGTVESLPLLTSSILSKKLAADLDGLVIDVKTGSGAFAHTIDAALELADSLVSVANATDLPTVALVTDMNQVLGRTAGNAVEVAEAIEFLTGAERDARLLKLVMALGREALVLGGLAPEVSAADRLLERVLEQGNAAERFAGMVHALGGPADLLERAATHLPTAPCIVDVAAGQAGIIQAIDVQALGLAIVELGGGRRNPGDAIDPRVGLTEIAGPGDEVGPGQPIARVHAATRADAGRAAATVRAAFTMGDARPTPSPLVVQRVDRIRNTGD